MKAGRPVQNHKKADFVSFQTDRVNILYVYETLWEGILLARLETFLNETDLLNRIHLLRREHNVTNEQLTIFSNSSFESVELNEDIETKTIDGSAGDKMITYFSAGEPEDRRIGNLGLTHEQEEAYHYALEHHQFILYIDNPDLGGVDRASLKNVPYDADTEVVDMNKVSDDGKRL